MIARDTRTAGPIVIAEDDPDDQLLAREALRAGGFASPLWMVSDGDELLDLLRREGSQRPAMVLLDLNMPRVNGFDVLKEMRRDGRLRDLPVIVLSTSQSPEDVARCYSLGCNSFLSKPDSYSGLERLMRDLLDYWFPTPGAAHGPTAA